MREQLPDANSLLEQPDIVDFLLSQNVLEHTSEDVRAVRAMGTALRSGGRLCILEAVLPIGERGVRLPWGLSLVAHAKKR